MSFAFSLKKQYTFCLPWKVQNAKNERENQPFAVGFQTVIEDDVVSLLKSAQPTRHIAVVSSFAFDLSSKESLVNDIQLVKQCLKGEIRAVYPNVSAGSILLLSYYRLQDATRCLEFIERKYSQYKAYYANPCCINKNLNEKIFVILNEQLPNALSKFDYMYHFNSVGSPYSISQTTNVQGCSLFNLEYDDERSHQYLFNKYHGLSIEGVQINVFMASNDQHVCRCHNKTFNPLIKTDMELPFDTYFYHHSSLYKPSLHEQSTCLYGCNYFDLFPYDTTQSNTLNSSETNPRSAASSSSSSLSSSSSSYSSDSHVVISCQESTRLNWKEAVTNSIKKPIIQSPPIAVAKSKSTLRTIGNHVDLERINHGLDTRTTFMIRNIPNKYTQEMLLDCINKTHANTFDFLYLRIDFKNKCNVGYAFINFIDAKYAISFSKEKVGKKWRHFNSDKKCLLSYANIQGKEALINKFKNSSVMLEQHNYRPKLFYTCGPHKGKEQAFPKK